MEAGTIPAAEASTGSKTMADLAALAARKHAGGPVARYKRGDEWVDVSFEELGTIVQEVGLGLIDLIPCDAVIGFDETTTGVPLGLPAGTEMTTQLSGIGLTISAQNNVAGHPNRAILFNSTVPTGEDPDLITPGYGVGKTSPSARS